MDLRYATATPAPVVDDAFCNILLFNVKVGVVDADNALEPNKAPELDPFKLTVL